MKTSVWSGDAGLRKLILKALRVAREDEEQKAHAQADEELAAGGGGAHAGKFTRLREWLVVSS